MWSWKLPDPVGDPRKRLLFNVGMPLAVAAAVGVGVATSQRVLIIIGVVTFGIFVLGLIEGRRARAFEVSLSGGVLSIDNGRETKTIDATEVTDVSVRHRSASSGGRWSVEAIGNNRAITSSIPADQGWLNIDEQTAKDLEAELSAQLGLARRSATLMQGFPSPEAAAMTPKSGDYEWRPPIGPNADRNRKRVRLFMLGAALLVAVYAGISERDAGTVGLILSITVVPGLIALSWAVVDWLFRVGRGIRVAVEDGHLVGQRSAKQVPIRFPLAEVESVVVDSSTHIQHTQNSHTRQTIWWLKVTSTSGDEKKMQLSNGFGLATTREDYALLEAELKARVG